MVLKTLWKKEKMLVTSIFSFSHNLFNPTGTIFQPLRLIYFVVDLFFYNFDKFTILSFEKGLQFYYVACGYTCTRSSEINSGCLASFCEVLSATKYTSAFLVNISRS